MANGSEKLLPRGIRNNNPGNIKLGTAWDGLLDEQNDDVFCQFKDPVWGIRALMRILLTYKFNHKIETIEKIINRWAPPSENDTNNYIKYVCASTSKKKDEKLANTIEDYLPLVKAIIRMENSDQPYEDDVLVEGMYKAWEGYPTKQST
ncbi:MAG: structural protein [Proteobacteria bacterium]|nr:structural protein [Pseudomonadota bacterium]